MATGAEAPAPDMTSDRSERDRLRGYTSGRSVLEPAPALAVSLLEPFELVDAACSLAANPSGLVGSAQEDTPWR